jgi:geranylgeranyl diphosphate synthase, type I
MLCVHAGQGADIWWHGGRSFGDRKDGPEPVEPNIEQYLHMCANKTGALARLAAKLAATASRAQEGQVAALGRFAETLGVAFQIFDDILNLTSGDGGGESQLAALKGGVGDDIHEGKRTIMVLHALAHAPAEDAQRLRAILNAHTSDGTQITAAIQIMADCGSIEYARNRARELTQEAWAEVDGCFDCDTLAKRRLHSLASFLIDRDV